MNDFGEDPLDLLSDDGDSVNEMFLLLDENNKSGSKPPPSSHGCCIVLLAMGSTLVAAGWGIKELII